MIHHYLGVAGGLRLGLALAAGATTGGVATSTHDAPNHSLNPPENALGRGGGGGRRRGLGRQGADAWLGDGGRGGGGQALDHGFVRVDNLAGEGQVLVGWEVGSKLR